MFEVSTIKQSAAHSRSRQTDCARDNGFLILVCIDFMFRPIGKMTLFFFPYGFTNICNEKELSKKIVVFYIVAHCFLLLLILEVWIKEVKIRTVSVWVISGLVIVLLGFDVQF